jgi:hypothetical protein
MKCSRCDACEHCSWFGYRWDAYELCWFGYRWDACEHWSVLATGVTPISLWSLVVVG